MCSSVIVINDISKLMSTGLHCWQVPGAGHHRLMTDSYSDHELHFAIILHVYALRQNTHIIDMTDMPWCPNDDGLVCLW